MRAWVKHNERVNMKYLRRGKTVDRALGMRVETLEALTALCAILGGLCYLMTLVLMAL